MISADAYKNSNRRHSLDAYGLVECKAMDENTQARQEDELSTQNRARILGARYQDARMIIDRPLVKDVLNVQEMYKSSLVPLSKNKGHMEFAFTINTPQQAITQLKDRFSDYNITFVIISNAGFKDFMLLHDPPVEVHYDNIEISTEGASDTLAEVSKTLDTVSSDDIFNYLISQADRLKASDIHLETEEDHVRMRFRVDGALHSIAKLSHDKYKQLQSSIAIQANISSTAPDAQTGHMTYDIKDEKTDEAIKTINMRIETVPTLHGQDAVIRLFNLDRALIRLDRLGFNEYQMQNIKDIIDHPHGMVLVVGPTGSGKTTTMYAILDELNNPNRKIITLEDPVEYGFEGISQIPVNTRKGKSFNEVFRAVLRQDPDVIMVGEIRDVDTARTALQAALTGHLVLSTFHAADAAAALSRMLDSIGDNPLFSSAIQLVLAQRLVRRLDDELKQAYTPDEALKEQLTKVVDSLPEEIQRPNLENLQLYKPGKSEKNPFGYKGRVVIAEQLKITPAIQAILRRGSSDSSTEIIAETAKKQGMVTMLQLGVMMAIRGDTSIEEVYRVVS